MHAISTGQPYLFNSFPFSCVSYVLPLLSFKWLVLSEFTFLIITASHLLY